MRAILPSACAIILGLMSTGCGPAKGSLTGKVTLDGTPLKGGRVDFANKSGGNSASAEIDENGVYSIESLSGGEYSITVTTEYLNSTGSGDAAPPSNPNTGMRPGGPTMPPPGGGGPKGGPPKDVKAPGNFTMPEGYKASMPGDARKKYVKIPGKYADAAQSGLTFTSPGGNQTHDIPLVGK